MNKAKKTNNPSLGLALGGGVARGLAHVGVLQALEDNQIVPDYIAGTSAGAFVGALYAFGVPVQEIYDRAAKLRWPHLSAPVVSPLGLASNQVMGKIVNELVGEVNIEDSMIPLLIVATDIVSGEEIILSRGSLIAAIMASTCIPGVFKPVKIEGRMLVDGGLVDNVPVLPLKEKGMDVVIAVNVSPHGNYRTPTHLVDVLLNAYDISTGTMTARNLKNADVVIAPNVAAFSRTNLKQLPEFYKEGYETTVVAMPRIKEVILAKSLGRIARLVKYLRN